MEEIKIPYRWAIQKNGLPYVAIVTLNVHENPSKKNEIFEKYSGLGFTNQGNIESIPLKGYESWKIGAKHGLEYAFTLIDTFWKVEIEDIQGLTTDTNATIVAYAVMRAFFDKIGYQLDSNQITLFEEFVFRSWTKPQIELIPNLFDLTFTEYSA